MIFKRRNSDVYQEHLNGWHKKFAWFPVRGLAKKYTTRGNYDIPVHIWLETYYQFENYGAPVNYAITDEFPKFPSGPVAQ